MPISKESNDDFFDLPSPSQKVATPISKKEESFFDLPAPQNNWVKPPPPSTSEQLKNFPYLFAREGKAAIKSFPSSTAETYRFLASKLQKLGEDQAAEQGREITPEEKALTSKFVNFVPDLVKQLGEKFPSIFPTYQQARAEVTKQAQEQGLDLPAKGRGFIERSAEGLGKAVPVVAFPGSNAVKAAALGTSALTEGLDLSEGKKIAGNLTVPVLTSIVESIIRKRYTPPKGMAEELYKEGKRLGMTDEQLAPILATEGQIERHGALASGVPRTRKAFEKTGEVLGNVIEDMQNRPQNSQPLPSSITSDLLNDLHTMRDNIRKRTHSLSGEEQSALNFIDNAIQDIQNYGATNRQLIGTWRSVNKSGANKRDIQAVKEPLLKAIESTDKQLAQDLISTNKLYSKYISNIKEINPSQFNAFIDAGELQQLLGAVFTGQPQTLGKQVLNMASLGAWRRVSSRILTDPKAQSLVRNFGKAVRDGKGASARSLGIQLKEYVEKNLPDDSEEIDWEALGL